MDKKLANYSKIEFWLNLVFQRGALAVAEVAGTLLLFRGVFSPTFSIEAAGLGSGLLIVGVVFEYLIWTKTTVFVSRQVEQMEALKKKISDEQIRLIRTALEASPRGAATPSEKGESSSA